MEFPHLLVTSCSRNWDKLDFGLLTNRLCFKGKIKSKKSLKLKQSLKGTWMKLIMMITIKLIIKIILMIILIRTITQLIIVTISIITVITIIMTIIIMISFCLTELKIFGDWLMASFSFRADNRSLLQDVKTCTYYSHCIVYFTEIFIKINLLDNSSIIYKVQSYTMSFNQKNNTITIFRL